MGVKNKLKSAIKNVIRKDIPYNRTDLNSEKFNDLDMDVRKILNLLNYTKKSGSHYNAEGFDIGYHSFNLGGIDFRGQRDPKQRLAQVKFDFKGKKVLDLGCNQGGMLHALGGKIEYGMGVDFDSRMINTANRIAKYNQAKDLDFYVFDLEKENLELLYDFSRSENFDIVFMLSISMWIKNWQDVLRFAASIAKSLLFETNGTPKQQLEQITELKKVYNSVILLADKSEDDPGQKERQLFICKN